MDNWFIGNLDAAMIWAQKRGISLVWFHCAIMGGVAWFHMARSIVSGSITSMFFNIFWLLALSSYLKWGWRNRDYRENWRLAQTLNMHVVRARSFERGTRIYGLPFLFTLMLIIDIPDMLINNRLRGVFSFFGSLFIILAIYLNTSTFLAGGVPRSRAVPNGVHADGR